MPQPHTLYQDHSYTPLPSSLFSSIPFFLTTEHTFYHFLMHHFNCLTSGHFYHQDLLSRNFKIFPPKYRFFLREILWQLLKCHSSILIHALPKYIISPFRPDLHVFFFCIPRTQYKLGSVRTGG